MHLVNVKFFPQVDKLKKEIETQQKEKAALESRANEAERKTRELNSKVESVSSSFGLTSGKGLYVLMPYVQIK